MRTIRTVSRYFEEPKTVYIIDYSVLKADGNVEFREKIIAEDVKGNVVEFDDIDEAWSFITQRLKLWWLSYMKPVSLVGFEEALKLAGVEVKKPKTLVHIVKIEEQKKEIEKSIEEVKLPVTIDARYHHTGNLYDGSYDVSFEITESAVYKVLSGRFSRQAEKGYKQCYEVIKHLYRIDDYEVFCPSSGDYIYVVVRDGARYRCFRARVPVYVEKYCSYNNRKWGDSPPNWSMVYVLRVDYSSLTNFSGIETTYWTYSEYIDHVVKVIKERYLRK